MKPFRTLDLGIEFYDQAMQLEINGHLKDQLIRAASSIPLNLSEGNAKSSVKEKKRFYQTAYGSLKECQTIFKLLKHEGPINNTADHLGACLYKLIDSKLTEVLKMKS